MGTATAIVWAGADGATITVGAVAADIIKAGAIIAAIADCRLSLAPAFADPLPRRKRGLSDMGGRATGAASPIWGSQG